MRDEVKPPVADANSEAADFGLLFLTMADTTWRMIVPGVVLAGLGIYGDLTLHTKPWLTMVGLCIGLVVGAYLVKRQVERVK